MSYVISILIVAAAESLQVLWFLLSCIVLCHSDAPAHKEVMVLAKTHSLKVIFEYETEKTVYTDVDSLYIPERV